MKKAKARLARSAKRSLADPITTEVIRNFVVSCAEDMNAALYRSAFSSIIYEGRDSAVALLDKNGDMLGQSTGVPIFIGNIDVCVKYAIERYGDDLSPGDVIAMNDPYLQGTHGHDVTIIGPIFHKKQLVGFAASRAHWQDIGAIDAGTTMGSTSIFHEGIRLGPTRIVEAYRPIREWFDLLRLNNRMKDIMIGDLNAQIAALRTGERRLGQMLDRVGIKVFESAKENIYHQSEKLDREAIAAVPDGTYSAEGFLDNDGVTDGPIAVKVAVIIKGDRMTIDLTGSSGPVRGALNCGAAQTVSMIRLAYKAMIRPNRAITGGSFPTLKVKIPEECIFNAREPSACEWYFTGLGLLADLMITSLGKAMPAKAVAANYGDSMVAAFVATDPRKPWIVIEPTAGGWGAWQGSDGESAMINLSNGSFRNIPAEVYEVKHPMKVEEFSIRRDSGGPGRWRGGCGVVRSYRALEDCDVSLWFERSRTPAWGVAGGQSGRPPQNSIEGPQLRMSPLKLKAKTIPAGTLVRTMTGGGGGYGNPSERAPEQVQADVVDGYVSIDGARRDYGVAIAADTLTVDEERTKALRNR
jgi:N-methylhydantoinase B